MTNEEDKLIKGITYLLPIEEWPVDRFLGFDASSTTLGGACFDRTGRVLALCGYAWHKQPLADRMAALLTSGKEVIGLWSDGGGVLGVAVELPAAGDWPGAGAYGLGGPLAMLGLARQVGLTVFALNPTTTKNWLTGQPDADKELMKRYASLHAGVEITDDNTADALAATLVLQMAWARCGGDVKLVRQLVEPRRRRKQRKAKGEG